MLGIAATYFGLFFSKVQIQHVEITGNQKVAASTIEDLAWENINNRFLGLFASQSIFLEDPNALKATLLKRFPQIGDVRVQKKYLSTLSVVVSERQPFSVFCDSITNCFSIDTTGVIFEQVPTPISTMVITSDPAKTEIFAGEDVVNQKSMMAIEKIQTSLKQSFNINIAEALVSDPLIITTSEKWKIYFDPNMDINLQLTKLTLLLKDQIPVGSRKGLQYVYLQYKDRAYYK